MLDTIANLLHRALLASPYGLQAPAASSSVAGAAPVAAAPVSFAGYSGPATQPLNNKGQLARPLPGVPGHYITGDYEATLRNQGIAPDQAASQAAMNAWNWQQWGKTQPGWQTWGQ